MDRTRRVGLLLIALSVATFTAHSTRAALLIAACGDAGGRYVSAPPGCDLGGREARALGRLPQRRGAWLLALGPAAAVGGLVYGVGRGVFGRHSRDAG